MNPQNYPDLASVCSLLDRCDLPFSDLSKSDLEHFYTVEDGAALVAVIGLQISGAIGLLRSLAVAPQHRGAGHATAMVRFIERRGYELGVRQLYLLTTTAEPFFENHGYQRVIRAEVPADIRESTQFSSLCPDDAIVMKKQLC